MKIKFGDLEEFRQVSAWLWKNEHRIIECFDDPVFLRNLRTTVHSVRQLAAAIG